MKRDMHQIYDDVFKHSPVEDVKIIVGTRNQRDARNDLIQKRPKLSLLQIFERNSIKSMTDFSKTNSSLIFIFLDYSESKF